MKLLLLLALLVGVANAGVMNKVEEKVVELVKEVQKISNEAEGSPELANQRGMDMDLLRNHDNTHNHVCDVTIQSTACADSLGACLMVNDEFHKYCHANNTMPCAEGCYCCHTYEVYSPLPQDED